jgi:TolB-like protein
MADIFLSYARPDRQTAERLAGALSAAGYSVWWDRHLTGGAEFSVDIERELASCRIVLVVWSAAAKDSPWVKDEAAVGRDDGKLVTIALDDGLPPLGFRQYHAIDFSRWNGGGDAPEFTGLVTAIEARLRGEAPTDSAAAPRSNAAKPVRRSWLLGIAALTIAVAGYFLVSSLWTPGADPSSGQNAGALPRVAVSGLKARGGGELTEVAAAMTENIATGLSRFPHLHVAPRSVQGDDASYRLEGSLVRSGATLRLTVQLFKTATGEQVWGETYDRTFDEASLLAVQDDLSAKVVASVADSYGALMRDLSAGVAQKSPGTMTPYEAVLRHVIYRQRLGPEDHLETRAALEHAVALAPDDANVRAALAAIQIDEYKHSYNDSPDSRDRALSTARQAVTMEPDNAYANFILAEVFYFRQDLGAFRASAERAIALNPYDSDSMAMIGILMSYGGDWERGVELSERAMALNPNHPGWYRFGIVFNLLRDGDCEAALDNAQRINLPMYFADPYVRALAHACLGNTREAGAAAQEFLAAWPGLDMNWFREAHLDRWFFASPELVEMTIEGLQQAGIEFN